jgi:hypothetical protein
MCIAQLESEPCDAVQRSADGSIWTRPIQGWDQAMAALAKDEAVQHVPTGGKMGLWAVTKVGGTLLCAPHAVWAVNVWAAR